MPERRLDYLDSLRAVAVLIVFVMHVSEIFVRITPAHHWLFDSLYAVNAGRIGVVTFFAISGFLIPSSLRGPVGPGLARFAVTRVCRLYPAYLVSLVPSFLTYQLMTQGVPFTGRDVLYNLTMVPRLFDVPMANGAYWTLEVELAFYAACAFLFAGGVLARAFVPAALMAGLGFVFYSSQGQIWGGLLNVPLGGEAFFFCLNLACMFWGAALRRWWDGERLNAVTILLVAAFSAYWLAWMPALLLLDRLGYVHGMDGRLVGGYSIGLGLFALGMSAVRIRARPVAWFGRISYSFYLTHQAGLYLPYWIVRQYPVLQHRSMAWYVLASAISSTALAAASFYAVERPSIRLGRRIVGRFVGRFVPGRIVAGRPPPTAL